MVLLTKVAREVKQHDNIQNNIVISGLPERNSSEVKERIESDRAVVNKLVDMLDVDMSKVKRLEDSELLERVNKQVPDQILASLLLSL